MGFPDVAAGTTTGRRRRGRPASWALAHDTANDKQEGTKCGGRAFRKSDAQDQQVEQDEGDHEDEQPAPTHKLKKQKRRQETSPAEEQTSSSPTKEKKKGKKNKKGPAFLADLAADQDHLYQQLAKSSAK